jgi:hypothetical protein
MIVLARKEVRKIAKVGVSKQSLMKIQVAEDVSQVDDSVLARKDGRSRVSVSETIVDSVLARKEDSEDAKSVSPKKSC